MEKGVQGLEDSQRRAIKKFIIDYRNPQGALFLVKELGLTPLDYSSLLQEIIAEAEKRNMLDRRQFDIQTMRYLTLREWIEEYFMK